MLFEYCRKKQRQKIEKKKKKKSYLPTQLAFLEHVTLNIFLLALLLTFFGTLVNNTFSNLELYVFIVTGICSSKYVRQVVLIDYNWISPTLPRRWRLEFFLFSKKWGGYIFLHKRERLVKW